MPAAVHPTNTFIAFENTAIERSITARFEQQVARYPDRLAVVTPELQFTYAELNHVANRIARAILARVGDGEEPVTLLLEQGPTAIAAILGVLKAGKIYVSLDPAFPRARTAGMLEDSRAKLLVTDTKCLSQARRLMKPEQQVLNCDDLDPTIPGANLDRLIGPDTRALILYTSGSTGQPKGVLHNHRNILVETRNYTNDLRICPYDRVAMWHSCSFATAVRNIYAALLNGAALFPYDLAAEGFGSLAEWLRTNRITILHTLPTTFRHFLGTVTAEATFPTVRILLLGGEAINRTDVNCFQRHFSPHCVLVHAIGPTETFIIRRLFITHDWRGSESKIPVGYPVSDKEILLLDESGREIGPGQVGEIAVKSRYVALGYWRRPELTEAAFIPDPHGGQERLYLTGDLGTMRPDDCLFHMGRKDFQVKIRGYRVEVDEIEAALLELDSIKAAAVHVKTDDAGEQRLIACLVPVADAAPTVSELRRQLTQALPDYMIPSAFVFLETLPMLRNGKIDRRALPAPERKRPALNVPYVAPHTSIESDLARIWAEVLDIDEVGIDDNFLELGGDSLLAIRILSRVNKTFRLNLSIKAVFNRPTVARMGELIALHREL
ncbi:MAG TPA: non-ribosomal peptide synthetase [Candidatus Binatia bacterium]|jgi:amino acid adenylation domain-containing protein